MKQPTGFRCLLLILCLGLLACQAISLPLGEGDSQDIPSQKLLFQDDFSNPSSGWDRIQDAEGTNDYQDGSYRILVNIANTYFWSTPSLNFSDVIIEVDATKVGGPDENDLGIICRYRDNENFYFLTISSDGYYGIGKFQNGEESLVGMETLQFNDQVVKTGNVLNHLRVECRGDNLTLIANGQTLADVKDSSFTSGDVGIIVGTYDEAGADVLFDNFIVTKP
ncbi:MAG: hypothetical protein JW726_10785 [Anaerolineales bacterium]|nr:hypothetical protein [Anaerolineales bacterium]